MKSGRNENFFWIVSPEELQGLPSLVVEHHEHRILAITSFDSGPLVPSEEEEKVGWTAKDKVMYSPPLKVGLEIPNSEYDEWYIGPELALPCSDLEIFVNYFGFSLVPPEELFKEDQASQENESLEVLTSIQSRFWAQIQKVNPETFVAYGGNDIVVSRNKRFIEALRNDYNIRG